MITRERARLRMHWQIALLDGKKHKLPVTMGKNTDEQRRYYGFVDLE